MSARGGGFPDLLVLLGYGPDDPVVVSHKRPGGMFVPTWTTADKAPEVADDHADSDVWFGVNAMAPKGTGRGEVADVTRLTALYCDLDVKPGGMPSMSAAVAAPCPTLTCCTTRPNGRTPTGGPPRPAVSASPCGPTCADC